MSFVIDTVNLVGKQGVTFTPRLSASGVLTWTNDGGLPNPNPLLIKGKDGADGIGNIQVIGDISSSEFVSSGKYILQEMGDIIYLNIELQILQKVPSGTKIFTIDERFRPKTDKVSGCVTIKGFGFIQILTNGDVTIESEDSPTSGNIIYSVNYNKNY